MRLTKNRPTKKRADPKNPTRFGTPSSSAQLTAPDGAPRPVGRGRRRPRIATGGRRAPARPPARCPSRGSRPRRRHPSWARTFHDADDRASRVLRYGRRREGPVQAPPTEGPDAVPGIHRRGVPVRARGGQDGGDQPVAGLGPDDRRHPRRRGRARRRRHHPHRTMAQPRGGRRRAVDARRARRARRRGRRVAPRLPARGHRGGPATPAAAWREDPLRRAQGADR